MVVESADADRLADELVRAGYPVTRLGSSGGFLRRHSSTLFSAVSDEAIDDVIAIARRVTSARAEFVPVRTLPFLGEMSLSGDPAEVRRGGAVVWVLPVERFERL